MHKMGFNIKVLVVQRVFPRMMPVNPDVFPMYPCSKMAKAFRQLDELDIVSLYGAISNLI